MPQHNRHFLIKCFAFLAALLVFFPSFSHAAKRHTLESALQETADLIAQEPLIPANANIAVVGFVESTTRARWPLSSTLEDDLSSFLITKRPGKVIAKNHIDTILRELRITRDDLFDSKKRKQFGKLASADLLVSGTYWVNRQMIVINITVVNIENGLGLFAHRVKVRKSEFAKDILNNAK